MDVREIKGEDYTVEYDPQQEAIAIQGELSLSGPPDYAPIADLLKEVADREPPSITLDLTQLEFLNSSGISMLSKFVIYMRKKKQTHMKVIGSNQIPWQGKSLKNFEKLLPGLKLELK